MSREQAEYERDWSVCRRCQCRRPMKELRLEAALRVCIDRGWCDRVVLWREEQTEVAEETRKRAKRPRRRTQSRVAVDEDD